MYNFDLPFPWHTVSSMTPHAYQRFWLHKTTSSDFLQVEHLRTLSCLRSALMMLQSNAQHSVLVIPNAYFAGRQCSAASIATTKHGDTAAHAGSQTAPSQPSCLWHRVASDWYGCSQIAAARHSECCHAHERGLSGPGLPQSSIAISYHCGASGAFKGSKVCCWKTSADCQCSAAKAAQAAGGSCCGWRLQRSSHQA